VDVALVPVEPREYDEFFAMLAVYNRELDAYDPLAEISPWDPDLYREGVLEDLEGREMCWIVADGARAGLLVVRTFPDWPDDRRQVASISELYVTPPFRRRGIARAVVEAVLAEHRRRGTHLVQADILRDNEPARAFWALMGFDVVMYQTARRP
jgi:ribosomal protein S18 acetylase RimI-like enzyme